MEAAVEVCHGVLGSGAHPQRPRLVMRAAQQVAHLVGWIEWVVVRARERRGGGARGWARPAVPGTVLFEVLGLRRVPCRGRLWPGRSDAIHQPPQSQAPT